MRSLVIFLLIVGLMDCRSSSQPEPIQYSVPADVEPFLKSFRDEAAKRSKSVSTANLIVTFGAVQTEDVCGQCILENDKTPRIILNADDFCWKKASTNERECLVFHELGHCLMNRAHKTEKFANGPYVSLMNPDNVAVYATCRYPIGDDECDKRDRRGYYIDELFDPATAMPVWAK